ERKKNLLNSKEENDRVSLARLSKMRWWVHYAILPLVCFTLLWILNFHFLANLALSVYLYLLIIVLDNTIRWHRDAESEKDFVIKCKKLRLLKRYVPITFLLCPVPMVFYYRRIKKRVFELRNQARN